MSRNQRPKIDEYPEYLFIVLHFPVFDKQVGRLNAGELDLFVGPDYIITLPNQPLKPVEYLFERCRTNEEMREQYFSKGTGYLLYQIVDQSLRLLLPDAAQDREQARAARGGDLQRPLRGDRARHLQREAGDHQLPQDDPPERTVLRDLERTKQRYMREDLEVYFDDIVDASERIWDMLENYKEVVEALEDTNESVISHRVNDILRVLTVDQRDRAAADVHREPLGHEHGRAGRGRRIAAFWIIVGVMVAMLVGMVGYLPPPRLAVEAR